MRKIEESVSKIIKELGFDLDDPNFVETPRRVRKFYEEIRQVEEPHIKTFPSTSNEMVVLKNFTAYSLCPHHLLPVSYTFRVGYIPTGLVIGLSKIPRLIHWILRDFPLQEDIPLLVVQEIEKRLQPMGAGCQVIGKHMCMEMRGVRTEGQFVTTKLTGIILLNPDTHNEFLTC